MSDIDSTRSPPSPPHPHVCVCHGHIVQSAGKVGADGSEDAQIHGQRDLLHVVTAVIQVKVSSIETLLSCYFYVAL